MIPMMMGEVLTENGFNLGLSWQSQERIKGFSDLFHWISFAYKWYLHVSIKDRCHIIGCYSEKYTLFNLGTIC